MAVLAGSAVADDETDSGPTAMLSLRGVPDTAVIFINNNPVPPPFSKPIEVPAGAVELRITTNGMEIKKSFLLIHDEQKVLNFSSNPDYATVDVISEPLGAAVFLNSKTAGVTPFIDSLVTPGYCSIVIKMYGYDSVKKEVNLLPQEQVELTYELKHSRAWLDSIAVAKIRQHKKLQFIQRLVYGAIGIAGGGIALYFDRTAQRNIDIANTSAEAYDSAKSGFQGYKNDYDQSRASAKINIDRRNISAAIAVGAAAGFFITFLF